MSVITTKGNVNGNQTINTEGGKSMKKMVKNNKGFSLIELLIVVAILAILAAISINLFGGVLGKQKVKADKAAANYLQTSIQTYIAETDDPTFALSAAALCEPDVANGGAKPSLGTIIKYLSEKRTIKPDSADKAEGYGPYINVNETKLSQTNKVLQVAIDTANMAVQVTVVDKGADAKSVSFVQYDGIAVAEPAVGGGG